MTAGSDVQRIRLQPAYVLHSRDYRDTSAFLDVLTPAFGRVSLLAKGVKQSRFSARRAVLQPFRSLLVSWQGRGDLYTLTQVEEQGKPLILNGVWLICGYYISELTQRLATRGDASAEIFALYDATVRELAREASPEPLLRMFEVRLLHALGYAPDFSCCVNGHEPVDPEMQYRFTPEFGAVPASLAKGMGLPVSGRTLIALERQDFSASSVCTEAKQLLRGILRHYLGDQPLRSRELFKAYAKK